MKIMAVCGSGLGSSFMMEMNIKKVLAKLGVEAEVSHTDLSSVVADDADLFVMAKRYCRKQQCAERKTHRGKKHCWISRIRRKIDRLL